MVNVYEDGEIITRVNYNSNLDYWDGRNKGNGGTGYHKGITRLRNGKIVIIFGSDWQGDTDTAEVVSEKEALKYILESGNDELLEEKRFADLKKLYEEIFIPELEEEEDFIK